MTAYERELNRSRHRRYWERNKDKIKARQKVWRDTNKEKEATRYIRYYESHKDERAEYQRRYQEKNGNLVRSKRNAFTLMVKEAAMNIYTNGEQTCRWCWQGDLDVLCLDHLENNGQAHRKSLPYENMIRWAYLHDYPPLFQVLCANCNLKKHIMILRGEVLPR